MFYRVQELKYTNKQMDTEEVDHSDFGSLSAAKKYARDNIKKIDKGNFFEIYKMNVEEDEEGNEEVEFIDSIETIKAEGSATMKKYLYKGKIVTANSKEEAKKKVTARFTPTETKSLQEVMKILEKLSETCGRKFYFELDEEKEIVNVYLEASKKYVYLSINIGSDSPAAAVYDIWSRVYSKI